MNRIIHSKLNRFGSLPTSIRFKVSILTIIGSAVLAGVLPLAGNMNEYLLLLLAMLAVSLPIVTDEAYEDYPEERLKRYVTDPELLIRKTQPTIKQQLPRMPVTNQSRAFPLHFSPTMLK
ncbi:MAG TPA: hypothetical protein VN420_01655 [Candidatus Fimivivens sp.]|nr:hypothetical protein [Candidatus Fimivivens sp.]